MYFLLAIPIVILAAVLLFRKHLHQIKTIIQKVKKLLPHKLMSSSPETPPTPPPGPPSSPPSGSPFAPRSSEPSTDSPAPASQSRVRLRRPGEDDPDTSSTPSAPSPPWSPPSSFLNTDDEDEGPAAEEKLKQVAEALSRETTRLRQAGDRVEAFTSEGKKKMEEMEKRIGGLATAVTTMVKSHRPRGFFVKWLLPICLLGLGFVVGLSFRLPGLSLTDKQVEYYAKNRPEIVRFDPKDLDYWASKVKLSQEQLKVIGDNCHPSHAFDTNDEKKLVAALSNILTAQTTTVTTAVSGIKPTVNVPPVDLSPITEKLDSYNETMKSMISMLEKAGYSEKDAKLTAKWVWLLILKEGIKDPDLKKDGKPVEVFYGSRSDGSASLGWDYLEE